MEPTTKQPELTAAEWEILLQLVQRELAVLPGEIHHTVTRRMREELRARMEIVEALAKKIEPLAPHPEDSPWAAAANC